ncbi:uncharacterized protein LOC130917423 [Corythoichthys intestinalis]|uniref:uncharacterized protein LOC130917423 n=1 Tax=Corythoichthys intestinalis TaxID=161448 RepID=UPI0025A53CA1|nr:uncharacterized protein LOC130917423 [Corythoichthys intestinalis]
MNGKLNLAQAIVLFDQLEEEDGLNSSSSSSSEECSSEDSDGFEHVGDAIDEQSDNEKSTFTARMERGRGRRGHHGRAMRCQRRRGWRSQRGRSRSPLAQPAPVPWSTEQDTDTAPQCSRFTPRRPPGPQVNRDHAYTPKELFDLFFTSSTLMNMCKHTNQYGRVRKEIGKKFVWTDTTVEELEKFIGLLLYMSLVSLPTVQDYWKARNSRT